MDREIAPIQVRPWTLNGMSERLLVSHYETNYGGQAAVDAAPILALDMYEHAYHLDFGAWVDPDAVEEWVGNLSPDAPIAGRCCARAADGDG